MTTKDSRIPQDALPLLEPQVLLRDESDGSVLSVYHRTCAIGIARRLNSFEDALRSYIVPFVEQRVLVATTNDDPDVRTCRICGCTDRFGCAIPCYWSSNDVCSNCVHGA